MRLALALGLTIPVLGCAAPAPVLDESAQNAIRAQVEASMDSVFAAASTLQIDPTIAPFADDQLHADQGALHTLEEIRTTYRELYGTLTSLSFARERTVVQVLGPEVAVALSEGTFRTTSKQAPPDSGHAAWTYIWRRQNGAWRAVHTHQSLVPPPSPP